MTEYSLNQKRKYLAQVLAMNPARQSAQIIAMRNQLLGIQTQEAVQLADGSKLASLRERVKQQIENIREQMWRQHPQQLARMLKSINVSQLPELKSAIHRLQKVIQNHHHIRALSSHPDQNINLTNTFRRVVMLPPRDSGILKEAYLRQIIESRELPQIKKMADMLQVEFPQLYALESDWLESIQTLKARRKPTSQNASAEDAYDYTVPGWLIWIGFVVLFRVVAWLVS